jgi:hypothetical protein
VRRLLLVTLVGTAVLACVLYLQGRERLKREARRFDELCPEASDPAEPPDGPSA